MTEEKRISVLVVEPDKEPELRETPYILEELQKIVGGYIEAIRTNMRGVVIICNEEGMMKMLPQNRGLLGTRFFTGSRGADFVSLTDDQVSRCRERIKQLEDRIKQQEAAHG